MKNLRGTGAFAAAGAGGGGPTLSLNFQRYISDNTVPAALAGTGGGGSTAAFAGTSGDGGAKK